MAKATAERCCAQVRGEGQWPRYFQCERAAKVTRDGHRYCTQHDPENVEKRVAKRRARADAQWKEHMHKVASAAACKGMNDPQGIVAGMIAALEQLAPSSPVAAKAIAWKKKGPKK